MIFFLETQTSSKLQPPNGNVIGVHHTLRTNNNRTQTNRSNSPLDNRSHSHQHSHAQPPPDNMSQPMQTIKNCSQLPQAAIDEMRV